MTSSVLRRLTFLLTAALLLAEPRSERRDHRPRSHRSHAARSAFQRSHPCPANGHTRGACPGYVVDHIIPLKRGGADDPSNMQWQTIAAAKAKDRVE